MKKNAVVAIALTLVVGSAAAAEMTEHQKVFYAIGQALSGQVSVFALTPDELKVVQQGLHDGVTGARSAIDMTVYGPKIKLLAEEREAAAAKKSETQGSALLARAAAEKGATKGAGGIIYRSLREGSGASPKADDTVSVNYRGTLPDGEEFDSSYKRGKPTDLPLGGVIKCWSAGLQMMKVGGKAKLTCPPQTAYGERSVGGVIPPNATLTFEIELLAIKGGK
ncbi:MAG: FKBP-type peptidyl-prolyl cis-trans isomerase [Burkholderiales bacterium]